MLTGHPEVTRRFPLLVAISDIGVRILRMRRMKTKASQKVLGRNQKKMSQDFWGWVRKLEVRPQHPGAGA